MISDFSIALVRYDICISCEMEFQRLEYEKMPSSDRGNLSEDRRYSKMEFSLKTVNLVMNLLLP